MKNKLLLSLLVSIAATGMHVQAQEAPAAPEAPPVEEAMPAAGGTITFAGEITSPTCLINGGNGGENFEVALPKVAANALRETGAVAGNTTFNINLSNCGYTGGKVRAAFQEGGQVDPRSGRLNLQNVEGADVAKNVQIELANAEDDKGIVIGEEQATNYFPISEEGSATLNYVARYYATGRAAAGQVRSQVTYVLQYE